MEFAKLLAKVVILNAAAVAGTFVGIVAVAKAFDYFNEKSAEKDA